MSNKTRVGGIEDGAELLALGNIYRAKHAQYVEWRVSGLFKLLSGRLERLNFSVELLPLLSGGRIYNDPKSDAPYYSKGDLVRKFTLPPISRWATEDIGNCPCVKSLLGGWKEFRSQPCFVFTVGSKTYWLPKLELYRKLFFYAAYLARASLLPNGLSQLLNFKTTDGVIIIRSLSKTGVPAAHIEHERYQQLFPWLLLNPAITRSFESVWDALRKEKSPLGNYEVWRFNFKQPASLESCFLAGRGLADPGSQHVLIREITLLGPLKNEVDKPVIFRHPEVKERIPSGGGVRPENIRPGFGIQEIELDGDEEPDEGKQRKIVEIPPEGLWLDHEVKASVHRNGSKKTGATAKPNDPPESDEQSRRLGLLDDVTEGKGTPGELDRIGGIEAENAFCRCSRLNELERQILNLSKLCMPKQVDRIQVYTKAIPGVAGFGMHLMREGRNRFYLLATYKMADGSIRCLLDIDTSDKRRNLAAKLFVLPSGANVKETIKKILEETVRGSMCWPTAVFSRLCTKGKSISHLPLANKSEQEQNQVILRCSKRLSAKFIAPIRRLEG